MAVIRPGYSQISPEVAALVQSLHPIPSQILRKGAQALKDRAKGVLINTLRVIERTNILMKSATYCRERAWLLAFFTRVTGQEYNPWDHLPLAPSSQQVCENNSPSSISEEAARRGELLKDRDKWQKIVQTILGLPFACDENGVLLPDVYKGLMLMNEVSVYFKTTVSYYL